MMTQTLFPGVEPPPEASVNAPKVFGRPFRSLAVRRPQLPGLAAGEFVVWTGPPLTDDVDDRDRAVREYGEFLQRAPMRAVDGEVETCAGRRSRLECGHVQFWTERPAVRCLACFDAEGA